MDAVGFRVEDYLDDGYEEGYESYEGGYSEEGYAEEGYVSEEGTGNEGEE